MAYCFHDLKLMQAKVQNSQFAGCVLDLLCAREHFNEQREHLNNANQNLAQFVGDGEARDVEIDGINHRVSNVGGSIVIVGG